MSNNNNWTDEVCIILEKMRKNCIELADRNRKNYYEYKSYSRWFDIPTIIVSVFSSSFSVGGDFFFNQELVSLGTCFISMFVAILGSTKLYLDLEELMKTSVELSKSFSILALDIYKVSSLPISQRKIDALEYLNKSYSNYISLVEKSNLLRRNLKKDFLLEIDPKLISDTASISSKEEEKEDEGHHRRYLETDLEREL